MVTQFGYVTVWSIVWPLAPIFALINNYFELRTDALKICKHVRRPIGDRVETIGSWLETLVKCKRRRSADQSGNHLMDRRGHQRDTHLSLPPIYHANRPDTEPQRPLNPWFRPITKHHDDL